MPRVRIEIPRIRTSDGPMLCRYGCAMPAYWTFGCCIGCQTQEEPKDVPWVKCEGCRRALDALLGSAATNADRMCEKCRLEIGK